jgi:carboxyl-terminal processing protease
MFCIAWNCNISRKGFLMNKLYTTLILTISLSINAFAGNGNIPSQNPISNQDIERFAAALTYVQHHYVKPTKYQKLFDDAIRGMLTGLDPHSDYMNQQDLQSLSISSTGSYGGIGIEVVPENGLLRIISPFDDTPAKASGIQPGDMIIKVDDKFIKNIGPEKAINMIRGPKGSNVNLTILRKNATKPQAYKITRSNITIKAVRSKMLSKHIGYVRIALFSENTSKDLKEAAEKMKKNNGKLSGLVVDLRNNPGGLLDAAIEVSDHFLDSNKLRKNKLIVYTKGRSDDNKIIANASPGELFAEMPIVVLINQGSASASEIVAGALKDHKRAVIVGTQSFGKGSVQAIFPIDNNAAIKLTTALYYTPKGRTIQAIGIKPDILAPYLKMPNNANNTTPILLSENNMMGHITHTEASSSKKASQVMHTQKMHELKLAYQKYAHEDFQLYQAINALESMLTQTNWHS